MRDSQLSGDDVPRQAVGAAEVRVAGRDHTFAVGAVGRVVEEPDDLLGDGALGVAAAVGGDDEDVVVVDTEAGFFGAQGDPRGREAEFLDEAAGVARRR